jgi:hypothetical protein
MHHITCTRVPRSEMTTPTYQQFDVDLLQRIAPLQTAKDKKTWCNTTKLLFNIHELTKGVISSRITGKHTLQYCAINKCYFTVKFEKSFRSKCAEYYESGCGWANDLHMECFGEPISVLSNTSFIENKSDLEPSSHALQGPPQGPQGPSPTDAPTRSKTAVLIDMFEDMSRK